jgi:hypothetical protein
MKLTGNPQTMGTTIIKMQAVLILFAVPVVLFKPVHSQAYSRQVVSSVNPAISGATHFDPIY